MRMGVGRGVGVFTGAGESPERGMTPGFSVVVAALLPLEHADCLRAEDSSNPWRLGTEAVPAYGSEFAMEVLFDRVAGLDIGKETLACRLRGPGARRDSRRSETRTFKTTTGSLKLMRDWLLEQGDDPGDGVDVAVLEAAVSCLKEVMITWLLNAAHMKAVPGRKSDVRDAAWMRNCRRHRAVDAVVRATPPPIRRLRLLTRSRVQLMGDRTREIQRLELMLDDASIKLSSVASSLSTVSARAILTAMNYGETDQLKLAGMARGG